MNRFRTSCLAAILVMSTKSWAQDAAIAGSGASPKEMAKPVLEWAATGIEVVGVAVILLGVVAATIMFLMGGFSQDGWPQAFRDYRANLGRGILLGLELLVAADIIGTVAVTPSLENLAVLAVIVLIRTFLSFSLEVEIEGRWPWQRNRDRGRSA